MLKIKLPSYLMTDEQDIKNYHIENSVTTLTDAFSFTLSNNGGRNGGLVDDKDTVEIFDDGDPLMTGQIDTVDESTEIAVSGRDLMAWAVDTDAEPCPYLNELPISHIQKLAKKVGLKFLVGKTPIPRLSPPLKFNIEVGESYADAMVRLAAIAGVYLWLDRRGVLNIGLYDTAAAPLWHFRNSPDGSNCEIIHRVRSSKEVKSKMIAYGDIYTQKITVTDAKLKALGFSRPARVMNNWAEPADITKGRLERAMNERRMRSRVWKVRYGGDHRMNGDIPEAGKTALVSSVYSGVSEQKTLIASVRLSKGPGGTLTELELWDIE